MECATHLIPYGHIGFKDGYGMTLLHWACEQSDDAFIKLLFQFNVDLDEQDVFQRAPLALAAWRNNALGVQALLHREANREVKDIFGATPFLRAIQYAAVDAARVLLENGCDANARDHEFQTALHRAALSRDIPIIKLLGEKKYELRGLDVDAKDRLGKTARERLEAAVPTAELLKTFTDTITAIQSARNTYITAIVHSGWLEHAGEVFKDAKEYQSEASSTSSSPTSDNEDTM